MTGLGRTLSATVDLSLPVVIYGGVSPKANVESGEQRSRLLGYRKPAPKYLTKPVPAGEPGEDASLQLEQRGDNVCVAAAVAIETQGCGRAPEQ
ncbi:hypothetical protein NDU88_004799 [Pleurodeles waltl]|uniref:Uncharacterized protein n=1 Tax=Pleurodeles waltl TaxID=8319 RepID=A0AAV7VKV6_PLEWA|nr:hypothetical protein NDU88_004799 [Pleurodeles waltl]